MSLVNQHTSRQSAIVHNRYIFPVGQGCFAYATIDGVSVIYDCGSLTSPMRVWMYIDNIVKMGIKQIDYLFISHFDRDHVNCLEYLIQNLNVCNDFVPYIKRDRRIAYNAITYGAYQRITDLLQGKDTKVVEIEEGTSNTFDMPSNPVWEWIARSMFEANDWRYFDAVAAQEGVNVNDLEKPSYVTPNRTRILKAFKDAFGVASVNVKGLIMLLQKTDNAIATNVILLQGPAAVAANAINTGCLYVGDADLRYIKLPVIGSFLKSYNAVDLFC